MNHFTTREFWALYAQLPEDVQRLADASYALLQANPRHPSLHFKRVGRLWSARVNRQFRALAVPSDDGLVWFWIGPHDEYERIIRGS